LPCQRILIFANPLAGRGRGRVLAGQLERELASAGYAPLVFLDPPADLKNIPIDDAEAAICIGGDGTLRSVANLLFTDGRRFPPLLPVPMGTANLMGRHLGISWPTSKIITGVLATIRQRKIVHLDAGRANGSIFLLMVGIGVDAQVVHQLDRVRQGPIGMASYLLPAARAFAGYDFPPITVQVDGHVLIHNTPAIAFVGNVREYGTGFPILTQANPYDGLLDVCILPCKHWRSLIEIAMLIAMGDHTRHENVLYTQGRTIRVTSSQPVPVQADGDSAGFTPVEIDMMPGMVPFLLPVRW
jgi:diacylglycerol kinase family enzyme